MVTPQPPCGLQQVEVGQASRRWGDARQDEAIFDDGHVKGAPVERDQGLEL